MASEVKRDGYTVKRVLDIVGVPYQTLNLWAKTGLVRPSIADASGTGSERIYSFRDLVVLKVAMILRGGGVTTRSLVRVIRFLQEHGDPQTSFSEGHLVIRESNILLVQSTEELINVLRNPGQSYLAFIVDLPKAISDVHDAGGKSIRSN